VDSLVFPWARWWRRIFVSLGIVLAIAAAAKLAGGTGDSRASAEVRMLLDTPQSQLVNADPAGVETLPWRANLLSQLLGTELARQQIARGAAIPVDQLAVVDPDLATPAVPAPLPLAAAEAGVNPREVYLLSVHSDALIPLISLEAQAPDRGAAARLAEAAAHTLKISAAPADMPGARSFIAEPVGPITTRSLPADHRTLLMLGGTLVMLGVAIVLFGLWCAGVVLVSAIARSKRLPETKPAPRPTR
jgi:hypothetical protein